MQLWRWAESWRRSHCRCPPRSAHERWHRRPLTPDCPHAGQRPPSSFRWDWCERTNPRFEMTRAGWPPAHHSAGRPAASSSPAEGWLGCSVARPGQQRCKEPGVADPPRRAVGRRRSTDDREGVTCGAGRCGQAAHRGRWPPHNTWLRCGATSDSRIRAHCSRPVRDLARGVMALLPAHGGRASPALRGTVATPNHPEPAPCTARRFRRHRRCSQGPDLGSYQEVFDGSGDTPGPGGGGGGAARDDPPKKKTKREGKRG